MQLLNLDNYRFILISLSTIIVLFNTCDFATCIDASTKIKEFGYPLETHEVWTDDRAHLGLERIPHNGNTVIGKPVLLIHGLFLNSYIFTANKSSLSFVLSDAGFDVWLYNCRGVGLSRKLSIYKRPGSLPNMKRISWNFSFHEMGVYDLTAVIDFILKKTKHSKLNVVGYSLGATIAFVCLSDKPEYNAKINKLVLISPTTDFKTSPVSTFVKRFPNIVSIMLNGFDFIPYTMDPDSMSSQLRNICAKESILKSCKKVIEFVEGADLQINNNTVLDMVSVLPQPMSSKLLKHFFQMIMKGRLSHYDYGTTGNLLLYNKISSPDYDLSKVTTPTFMIHSTNDHLTPPTAKKIKELGYPLMTYQVWTADKYLLGLERIPHSKYRNESIGKPVLLLHGLYLSSAIFTINNSSLSYVLSDAGFDVWLFNARGVGLSRKLSIYKKPGLQPKMNSISWDFSFHEMGVYDMTTAIDFILKSTGHSKLDVVGYSLGTTISLACLSDRPEYNSKINKLVLMAPTSRLKSSGMPLNIIKQFSKIVNIFLDRFNFFPYTNDPDTTYQLIRRMCTNQSAFKYCRQFIDFAQGIILPINNDTILDIVSEFPQPMSSKTLKHMLQLLKSGRFSHYDYGPYGNLLHYHTKTAPDYDLSRITASTYIIYSKNDSLVHPKDVKWLITQLSNIKDVHYIDKIPFGHLSFSLSPIMKEVVNIYITNKLLDNNLELQKTNII